MIEELTEIANNKMTALLEHFVRGDSISGFVLPTEHTTTFKAVAIEATSLLDEKLGPLNDHSVNLVNGINAGAGGFNVGPSYRSVEETSKITHTAVRVIKRGQTQPRASPTSVRPYVDPVRIAALQAISNEQWDFMRLLELCREINVAACNRCHMSPAMLLRTILNRVPPVLRYGTFADVANSYGRSKSQKSFKASMQRLERSLRSIADMHLHSPIRSRENVPTAVQVDFAAELDVLIGEVIRVGEGCPE